MPGSRSGTRSRARPATRPDCRSWATTWLARSAGARAGENLAATGRVFSDTVSILAFGTAAAIVLVGALPVVLLWLTLRVRWMMAARSALAARSVGSDLLALRALTRRSLRRPLGVCADPAAAWRRGEEDVLRQLAALELHRLGLRAPRSGPGAALAS